MPRHIHFEPHLTNDDLEGHYRRTRDPVERSHWHFLWLLARGLTATAVASLTGYSAYWVGQIAHRYNRASRARTPLRPANRGRAR
jgi:hypothetical protein